MNNFKCPRCFQLGAKKSVSYPFLLVHKCDGVTLNEVAKFSEQDGSKKMHESYYCTERQLVFAVKEVYRINPHEYMD